MAQIKDKIKAWIKETLRLEGDFVLAHPKDIKNGDYSFYHSPERANDFGKILNENKISEVQKIEVVGNFINFYLSKDFFADSVNKILGKGTTFAKDFGEPRRIIIEYTDPNVMKPFHIGHLMSNTIGESISRLYEWGGADVIRVNYYSDSGLGIAKAVWGVKEKINEKPDENTSSLSEKANFLGKCYAYGVAQSEADEKIALEIREINKKIFDRSDQKINKIYDFGKKWSMDNFEKLYKRLGSEFDWIIGESEVAENGKKIVLDFLKRDVFEESDGAVIFRGKKYNARLHTRVFINKESLPTYEAKEIGLTKKKFEKYNPNQSMVITANEQNDYFKVVLEALSCIDKTIAERTKHISHGILRLSTGKMSSREGNVITAESLIEQVKEKVSEKLVNRNYSEEEKQDIAEIVAIGAIKYSILRQAIGGDIIFDFDKSISFEGDSGPYLQYTAVRANSVLERAGVSRLNLGTSNGIFDTFDTWKTTELERYLYRFPEVIERAKDEYAPHYIVTYLTELASIFNAFYAKEKIIDENDPTSLYKIALTQATTHILKSGLHLLGIKVPKKM